MAGKFKLSNDEKKRAGKLLEAMEDDENKKKTLSSFNNQAQTSQSLELPTAKQSSRLIPSYRQNLSTSMDRLPTAKLSNVDNNKLEKVNRKDLEAMEEAEKINKDIKNGDYNSSISNVMDSFLGGTMHGVSGIANVGLIPVAGVLQRYGDVGQKLGLLKDENNFFNNSANALLDASDYLDETSTYRNKVTQRIDNNVVKTASGVSNTIGEMMPAITSNLAMPGSSLLVTGLSAGGNSARETINNDRSNLQQAIITGTAKGLVEAGTEKLTGGNILSKHGSLDNVVNKAISNKIKSNIGKEIANKGYQFIGEMAEEQISDNAGYIIDKIVNNKDLPDAKEWWNNFNETNKMTFLTTLALNIVGLGGGKFSDNVDNSQYTTQELSEANKWFDEAQKIIDQENLRNPTSLDIQQANILHQNTTNNQVNLQEQQITSQELQTSQNQNMKQTNVELPVANEKNRYTKSQLDEMLNNKDLTMQNYIYEKSDNVKVNNLRQSASKYFNNTEQSKKYINMLEKIVTDKDVEIRFDTNLKTADGRIANGSYSNGVITINPNSSKAGEFIAIHELTHAIGTKDMIDMVEKYRKSDAEFNSSVEEILQNYKATEISEEALADVSAQLFGTQEFINNIAQTKPSVFKKIYNEIKYLWHQFRGYKNQSQFIEDLYYKWTEAYNSKNELNNTNNYLITQNEKGKYVKADRQVISGNNPLEWERQVENYINDSIRKGKDIQVKTENGDVLTITKDTSGKAKFRNQITDKNGNIRYLNNKEFLSKLTAETHIDELAKISKKINEEPVPDYKNHKFAKDGFDYRSAYFEDFDGQYYKITMSVGKNGNIDTIYNIGKMDKKNRSKSSLMAQRPSDNKITSNEEITSTSSIPSTNADVNTTTKYSMQEPENNSSSFNLSKNFDVTDNENLNNATTLFFRTREDGIYYVQATNGAGNITYDGTFIDKKSLAKTLGNDIADYIVNNSELTNNEIYLHSNKIENKTDYMMAHRPSEEYGNASNFEKNMNGVFEHPEWYINLKENYNLESLNALRKTRNKPDSEIIIYRATPGNEINPGDWVTPSRKYAELHNNSQLNGKGNILELKVKAKDILWGGDDINEFGYFPNNMKYSKNNQSWQNYLDKNFTTKGTRTNLQDILVQKADNKGSFSKKQETKAEQEKIAQILDKPSKKVEEKDRTWAIFKANIIDKGIVFEELSRKTNNRELQGKWDYTLTATARGQNAIGQARYEMDSKNKTQKQICKSLEDIRAEVGNKTKEFQHYMYHQLNIDRMTLQERFSGDTGTNYERKNDVKNKPVFGYSVTAEISRKIVEKYEQKNPEFKKWAQDVYDFNNANKQELVKNGVISQELADKLYEIYPHYVPIKRVNNKGNAIKVPLDTNRTGVNAPLAQAKGGNSNMQPLFETMAERTLQTYRASARNNFGVELMNSLNSFQEKQSVDIDTILENIGDADTNSELLQEGKNGNAPTFTVFNKGEKVTFEITKDMYDALKPLNDSSILSKTIKPLNNISNIRRGVLTEYNPLFLATNAIKDAQDVVINSQHPAKTYAKFPEAYSQIINEGYWYNEYIQNGGEQNSYFKDGEFESNQKTSKLKTALKVPLDKISAINNVIEMAPRLAEYIASRENGASIETSMLDASRVTTNFKAGGDVTKFANRNGATFLNASVQGFQQQVRNIQEAHAKGLKGYAVLATKYAIAGLPALILNALVWKDDEDYEELQDYVKDNYYIVAKYGDGQFIRIPKGRMAATMQKIVGNISKYITEDKELNVDNLAKDFWEDLQFGLDNVAPNNPLDNNVISPIIQAITNTSWYGEDIVPSRLQDKPKAEQYDESTDRLSIWLGEKLNASPYKINYLLDQYGGGISDITLPMMTKQAENNVVEDKFTSDSVMKNKYPGEFFSKVDELKVNSNSEKATDADKLKYKWISEASKTMNDYYKQKREIQNSNLSDEEKKKQIKEVQKKINRLAEDSINGVDNTKVNGDTANVNETLYYKYKGEWTKLSETDTKKTNNLSTATYADYKNKVYSMTQSKKASGEIAEDGQLKSKDKIQILLNSSYSKKEKADLYENYIANKQDKKYSIIKQTFTDNGLNIDKYLRYIQQEFEADKKEDGTIDGKSISGSKKKKVWNYINSIPNASYTQKTILYALEYKPASNFDKNIVINFVDNLPNKSSAEKLDILSEFKGATVYKNGSYKY